MPRQTFLSRESFVDATEKTTKETLYTLPEYVSNIKMLSENKLIDSVKFLYEQAEKKPDVHITVSVLPLNDQYTRISLNASYANGHTFYEDAGLSFALHSIESSIHAALKGDLAYFNPAIPRQKEANRLTQILFSIRYAFLDVLLKKKLS